MIKSFIRKSRNGALAALLLLSATATQAQLTYHMGLAAGPQYTTLNSDRGSYSGIVSYFGGLTNEFRFGENISFELDAMYSVRGADRSYKDSIPGYYDKYVRYKVNRSERITYVDVHALMKYNLMLGYDRVIPYDKPGKRTFLSFYAGPYFGNALSFESTGKTDTSYYFKPTDTLIQVKSDKRSFSMDTWKATRGNKLYDPILSTDLGISFGTGIYFLVGDRTTLHADLRGQWGLGTIDNDAFGHKSVQQNDDPTQTRIVYNYANVSHIAVQVCVGASIRLLGKGPNRNF